MTLADFVSRYFVRALLIPFVIVGIFTTTLLMGWQIHSTRKSHQMIADFLNQNISEYLSNAHHLLRVLAWEHESVGGAEVYEIRNVSDFYRILLVKTDHIEASIDSDRKVYLELMKAGVPVVYFPDLREWPAVSVPYYNPELDTMTVGVVVRADRWMAFGELNLASIYNLVMTWAASYPGTSVIITDKYGNIICHPDMKLVIERENLAHEPIFRKIIGYYGLTTTVGFYGGHYVLATGRYVGPWEWVVTIIRPLKTFFFPLILVVGIIISVSFAIAVIIFKFQNRLRSAVVGPVEGLVNLAVAVQRGEKLPEPSSITLGSDIKELKKLAEAIICTYKKLKERERITKEMSRELFWLVESIGDAVIAVDKYGRVMRMNGMAELLSGWNRFQAFGKPLERIFRLYEAEHKLDVARIVDKVVRDGAVIRLQDRIRLVSPDGSNKFVTDSISPLRDGDGNVTGAVVVFHDVTAQVEAEEEKRKLEKMLAQSQKMEALGTLASGIAHEFNNLLQILSGYVELALDVTGQTDRRYEWLVRIKGASERAKELVEHLLTFSREHKPRLQVLDVNRLILDTLDFLRTSIPRMIKIETSLAENLPAIKADPRQLELALINLVVNARDAIREGEPGVIRIRSCHETDVGCRGWVRIDVEDTGCGIAPDLLERIFEPFFTTKGPGKGTGLGLSAVYGIVQAHEGRIEVKSSPGQGSTFSVYLPVREYHQLDAPAEPVPDRPSEEAPATCHKKDTEERPAVLVVDDEQLVLDFVAEILRRENFEVLGATSGEEALELVDAVGKSISLIILDLNMPGMGGWKCLEEIRSRLPDVPVIIASGYISASAEKRAEGYRNVRFIRKPYSIKELLDELRKVKNRG
ncbi:hybrid sensor histidine kinase/response regulator [Thermodesulforhabdus norvegica]|uniref:histidine kinase n=1 Tax=Thermodesulforhabdus norvegica TaxID=39841 RepID=A0A1I4U8G8_9BACT|nr:ATP-binding protein [Thermodesulforhabdus norvegica]SFM85296.1 PAS domain S-box-containing protein [Thermodesulforhabdus norvegica]